MFHKYLWEIHYDFLNFCLKSLVQLETIKVKNREEKEMNSFIKDIDDNFPFNGLWSFLLGYNLKGIQQNLSVQWIEITSIF